MVERKAVVPSKALELAAAVSRATALLRIWEVDLETAHPDEIRGLCRACAEVLRDGALGGVTAALAAPAGRAEIARAVDELIAAFPQMRKDADLRVFSRVTAEEIEALAPTAAALQAAIRALIRTSSFPPSVKEVVEAVASHRGEWAARANLLERLPARVLEATQALERR